METHAEAVAELRHNECPQEVIVHVFRLIAVLRGAAEAGAHAGAAAGKEAWAEAREKAGLLHESFVEAVAAIDLDAVSKETYVSIQAEIELSLQSEDGKLTVENVSRFSVAAGGLTGFLHRAVNYGMSKYQ